MNAPGRQGIIELPGPNERRPVLTRVVSSSPFHEDPREVTWMLTKAHPFVDTMRIVRMFIGDDCIDIYSADDKGGMHNLLPMHTVRLVESAMPFGVLMDELDQAEADDPDDPDGDPEDEEPPLQPVVTGQAPS
jgi:hypothetical protein